MSPTPRTDLELRLYTEMAPASSDLTPDAEFVRATVDRATRNTRRASRHRLAYAVAAPLVAAAVTAGIIVVVQQGTSSGPDPAHSPTPGPTEPDRNSVDGSVPLQDWLENQTLDPASIDGTTQPAAAGTAMYRTCAGDECSVTLVSPSGERIDLADIHPELGATLAESGLEGVSISPNGHWLGRPDDGGYTLYHLDGPDLVEKVAADPRGDRWELVGWSEQSWAPTLALYSGDEVVRFADWGDLVTDEPTFVDVPTGISTVPVMGARPFMSPVTEPIEPVDGEWPRVATTAPPTSRWLLLQGVDREHRAGEVVDTSNWEDGYNGTSFEQCVGPDETLLGPDGRIHSWQVRGSRPVHADRVTVTTAVFSRDASASQPVAVLVSGCAEGQRVELPSSTDDETWGFLGMLADGQLALTRNAKGATTYVLLDEAGTLSPMHDLPHGADVVTPGGVTGD